MKIRESVSDIDLEQIKLIFRQYFAWITEDNGINRSYQGVESELDNIPGLFSPPAGCLLIAEIDNNPVVCVALRSFEPGICEMKRLFVKPEGRGKVQCGTMGKMKLFTYPPLQAGPIQACPFRLTLRT